MDPLKRKSGKLAQSMAKHFDSIHNTIIGIVVILVFISLPLAALIVGSMRINECPIQRMIPIWLLVVGVIGVAAFVCLIITVKTVYYLNSIITILLNVFIFSLSAECGVVTTRILRILRICPIFLV